MNEQLHNQKGVSVAEVVIALAIIAVISAFTLSLIVMSIGVESKSVAAIEVKNAAENAIECFRFAKNNAGEGSFAGVTTSQLFLQCLQKTGSYVSADEGSKFILEIEGCTITIMQITQNGEVGFKFVAVRGGEELERFTFPKEVE